MATLILGIVGGVAGGLIAGPGGALKGAMLGWSIGTTVGGIIDEASHHYYTADMGRTSDLRVTVASYGTSIPQCWGKTRIPGILIWGTDLVEHEQDVNSGGGGSGGPTVTTRNYTYTSSFAMLLCKGNRVTTNSITKIYADDLVVYDSTLPTSQNTINPRFYTGTETQNADPLIIAQASNIDIPAGSDNPAFRGSCYFVVQDMLLTNYGNRLPNFSVEMNTGTVYVSDVLTDVFLELGLTASQFDVSRVTAIPVTGMVVASRIDGKSAIQPILDAYSVDLADINGKITAVPRGGISVATITFADMGAMTVGSGNATSSQRITKTRVEDSTLPSRIDVGYFSPTIDMQQATQGAIKQSALVSNNVSVQYPLTLLDTEAKALAGRLLFLQYVERVTINADLMPKWETLSVTDPVLLQTDPTGTLERVRITEAEVGLMGEIKCSFVRDDDGVLVQQTNSATPTGGFVTYTPVTTQFLAWSGTELQSIDGTTPGFYVAATGGAGWSGCSILASTDGGSTYLPVGSCGARSVFGSVTNALGSSYTPNSNGFDATNTLNVNVNGALASTNENDVKNGLGNYGLLLKSNTGVDNSTDYEIFGFASVSLISANNYTISDLLRSQRNTVATGHANTDLFVDLSNSLTRIAVATNLINKTILVKCVSAGIDPSTVAAQSVYIATPTSPYATMSSVTNIVNNSTAARSPWYRTRYKVDSYNDNNGTTVPGSADFASGYVSGTWFANGPDGSVRFSDPGLEISVQFRIGLTNPTSSAISVPYTIPAVDNGAQGIFNGTQFFQLLSPNAAAGTSGTFSVPAGTSAVLELYFYNATTGVNYSTTNQATFTFFTNNMLLSGLSWYDPDGETTGTTAGNTPTSSAAGGDLSGTYPNPTLVASGVAASAYTFGHSATFDVKGRATAAANPAGTASNTTFLRGDGTWATPPGTNSAAGTVTSVGLSMPTTFTVNNSPVTGAGTLTVTWTAVATSLVLMGPLPGTASATPVFRTITAADLPVFVKSGTGHSAGIVPDPGATAGTAKFLREDATFVLALQKRKVAVYLYPGSAADSAGVPNLSQTGILPNGSGNTSSTWKLTQVTLRVDIPNANATTAQIYYASNPGTAVFGSGTAALTSALSVSGTATASAATTAFTGTLATTGLPSGSMFAPCWTALGGTDAYLVMEWEEV